MTDTDRRILEFVVMLKADSILDDTADLLGAMSTSRVFSVLGTLLNLPAEAIRNSLAQQGALVRSGLVSVWRSGAVPGVANSICYPIRLRTSRSIPTQIPSSYCVKRLCDQCRPD